MLIAPERLKLGQGQAAS